MDVRCEKCQTEYELDEARLKPAGVTVKCTNCGHMFKIRRRTITNVGAPPSPPPVRPRPVSPRPGPPSTPPQGMAAQGIAAASAAPRPESIFDDDARQLDEAPTAVDRQWLLRLENGEQKSCRELATLQQWIIAGVVTRESLISRTGKTWKRLGDIAELGQYFGIADEARANRDRMKPPSRPVPAIPTTMPGYSAAQAAGGTILPDDDPEGPTTRSPKRLAGTPPPPVPRGAVRTPPAGQPVASAAMAPTQPVAHAPPPPVRRAPTTPPPPPPKRLGATPPPPIPQGNRATATWATDGVKPEAPAAPSAGPVAGKLAAMPDEPAFAGRVRMVPGNESTFDTAKVRALDDDDDVLPVRRGTRTGTLVLVFALLVMGAAAAVVYVFAIRKTGDEPVPAPMDRPPVVAVVPDAQGAAAVAPPIDAAPVAAMSPLDVVQGELSSDIEGKLRTAAQSLDGKADAPSQAVRAHLIARLAQDLLDRASVTADRATADELRKESRQLVLDAATAAQRALATAGDDAGANIAMAEVLRLQGKPARDIQRYLDMARASADKRWARELALADAMVLARDGKLDDARVAFTAIDAGDGKLETSGDVRARLHLAFALTAQAKAGDAKPLVETILAAQPEHAGARALLTKLETLVAKTDPLPPEDTTPAPSPRDPPKDPAPRPSPVGPATGPAGGDSYDRLLARANALAETSCARAMELYARALEQKPNGVDALTGMGYCHIDAKQFASAFSKFRAALAVSQRDEAALRGIAEAYQQQGRKEQAIEAYKAYLEVYPNSVAAKRQLERLGGDTAPPAQPPPTGGESGSAAPPQPPAQPPAPPPQAPPAPPPQEPSGQGSGSG